MTTPGQGRNPAASHPAPAKALGSGSGSSRRARCVLWCPPDSESQTGLVDALQRHPEFDIEVVHSGYDAFALLCQRAAAAKATGDSPILVLVDPPKLTGAVRVMESAAIYAAASATWAFDGSTPPRFRGITLEEVAALTHPKPAQPWPGKPTESHTEIKVAGAITGPRPMPVTGADPGIVFSAKVPIDPPQLRLTGSDPVGPPSEGAKAQPQTTSHLLTDEELAMLLSSEPEDDDRR